MNFFTQQIIPASHWFAMTKNEDTTEIEYTPLVCWALGTASTAAGIEQHVVQVPYIVGMVVDDMGRIIPATDLKNFVGYDLEAQDFDIDDDFMNSRLN